ncbi:MULTISPECIES: hypothetical protein [unclassified Bradyrhizobium]|uniref:hypothetical protein n=1 Tax=unclassified Bradyrhizobium TaxID=2631580 RepID=UPI002916CD2E|nr:MULTISPECIES: hypothetical protein [unclassified Bradyrhizobium]
MQIIDQGQWVAYVPNPFPADLALNTAFAKRESDGRDWYDALYGPTPLFLPETVKATVWPLPNGDWQVQAVDRDATRIFPPGARVIEIADYAGADPFADLNGKKLDFGTMTLSEIPVVLTVTPRQIRLAMSAIGVRQQVEDYVKAAPLDVQDSWDYSTQFVSTDPMVVGCMTALGKTSADLDALFRLAMTL